MIVCTSCDKPCETKEIRTGYGRQEYFGAMVVDSYLSDVSVCCEADTEEIDEPDE
jgi:hypothetical protein